MAYDRIEKFPDPNTALAAGGTTTITLPLEFRHHAHLWRATATLIAGGAAVTDIANIIDTLEYSLAGRVFLPAMTVDEWRFRQNCYDADKYAGYQTDTLICNFREWQNQIQGDQDIHSIATGNVSSFSVKIKFKAGIQNIDLNTKSRIICDDGVFQDASGKEQRIPLVMTRTVERFGVQNSSANTYTLPGFDMRTGSIKRVTFLDGGKIDLVEVIHNNSVVQTIDRDTMKSLMLDMVGAADANASTATRFTIPLDFLNRGMSGIPMRDPGPTPGTTVATNLKFRIKTNAGGGFDGLLERVENPLNTAA